MNRYDLKKDGQWKLTKQNAGKASLVFDTKEEALKKSAEFMREHSGSMRVHKENGRFQEERTYPRSADPRQSPG